MLHLVAALTLDTDLLSVGLDAVDMRVCPRLPVGFFAFESLDGHGSLLSGLRGFTGWRSALNPARVSLSKTV